MDILKSVANFLASKSYEWYWAAIGMGFVISLMLTLLSALTADGDIECYYFETYSSYKNRENPITFYYVMGKVDWHSDLVAFKSVDKAEVLDALQEFPRCTTLNK